MKRGRKPGSTDGKPKHRGTVGVSVETNQRVDEFLVKYQKPTGHIRSKTDLFELSVNFYMTKIEEAEGNTLEDKTDGRGFPLLRTAERIRAGTGTEN